MALSNRYFHGKRVSRSHYAMLLEAEHRGLISAINQGRRTIAEQWVFWRIYKRDGHPVAAFPSPSAPHIKWGKENHAIDADAPQPVHHLADFYRSEGVPVAFNVLSEAWHMDTLDEGKLKQAARRYNWRDRPVIRPGQKVVGVRLLKKLLYQHGLRGFNRFSPVYDKKTVEAVKRLQKRHAIKPDGVIDSQIWYIIR